MNDNLHNDTVYTAADRQASTATNYPAFDRLNLLGIKREVAILLGLIGREKLFDEYTRHDISHINAMLDMLDWIVPETTKERMSPADWLMITLAIYFHDLGMLVTRTEFERRSDSGFADFCERHLFATDLGIDYKTKVGQLSPDDRERFLYQEFVRHKHAERIREWIQGRAPERLGHNHETMDAINRLLDPLDAQFRRDLAFVCESHHLNDLDNFHKYKLSQPYGNSDAETVNLQYAAILLRTVDLLHITRDRTPSIEFRVISPRDPISQGEWAKQMAVRRLRPQPAHDEDRKIDHARQRTTIEVHAYFKRPDGFFGLTAYLSYARGELQRCFDWAAAAQVTAEKVYEYPWRFIDDSNIETHNFLPESFEFSLHQEKILDLLTGHTLYNDTAVVIRELAQNSLDAIRLRRHIDSEPVDPGQLTIHWNSANREVTVTDNGTGMSESVIKQHLLRVGSSRYQEAEFKKQYPHFSPISRFGIGVLSAFMVADEVEIITCHAGDDTVRLLTLRSVSRSVPCKDTEQRRRSGS